MKHRRRKLASAAALVSAALGLSPARAQAPEPAQTVVPSATVEIVRIEVVVTEKRGRPKAGLGREDFVVLEDGRPQTLVHFEAVSGKAIEGRAEAPAEPPAATEVGASETSPLAPPRRYIVLAIDDLHTEAASLTRIKKALVRFLDEDTGPDDLIALVTTSGAGRASREFTSERTALQQSVSRLGARMARTSWMGVPHLTEYQAELIEQGDPTALDVAAQEIMQQGLFQDLGSAEEEARRAARAVFAESVHHSRLTLETLESVMRGLDGLEGRKAILFVSDGFLTGLAAGSGAGFDIRRITDAGTRAGVVLYALDSRGLQAAPPAATASSTARVMPSTMGAVEWMQRASEEATRSAMNALAADTGGFLVHSSNDLRRGLLRMLEDTETYYVLAYEPTNPKHDGSFRRIEVRVPGARDAKVRTRAGYFAPDDRLAKTQLLTAELEVLRAAQRESGIRTALTSLAPLTTIPVRLSADFVSGDGDSPSVVVSGHVDTKALPFVPKDDRHLATIDMVAVIYDESGEVAATLPERAAMSLTDADYGQALKVGLQYQKAAAVKPGRYQVRLAVREDAAGLLGSAWQWVLVPDLAPGLLTVSSLFLLKEGETNAATPPAPDTAPDLRNAQALRRFRSADRLYVQLYAYNPKRDASGATSLMAQAEILRDGVLLGTAAPEPMTSGEPQGPPVAHTTSIKLHRFDPGDYELRVTVTDRNAGAMVARQVGFTIN